MGPAILQCHDQWASRWLRVVWVRIHSKKAIFLYVFAPCQRKCPYLLHSIYSIEITVDIWGKQWPIDITTRPQTPPLHDRRYGMAEQVQYIWHNELLECSRFFQEQLPLWGGSQTIVALKSMHSTSRWPSCFIQSCCHSHTHNTASNDKLCMDWNWATWLQNLL